ncbi:protein ELYS-like [Ambystoma mexicanum]|uniref:protein ELYS-like n=1 Tax=Ambystoma mexicanum TaxID=8296 RepID=UPI0037E7DA7B
MMHGQDQILKPGPTLRSCRFSEELLQCLRGSQGSVLETSGSLSRVAPSLGWLTRGPALEVFNWITGQRISHHHFGDGATVGHVRDYSFNRHGGLLLEVQLGHGGLLCCYDLGTSRITRAIRVPSKIEYMTMLGDLHAPPKSMDDLHAILQTFSGTIAIGTSTGDVILLDLALRKELAGRSEKDPTELKCFPVLEPDIDVRINDARQHGRHVGVRLPRGVRRDVSAMLYVGQTNHLAVAYAGGVVQFWNLKQLRVECEIHMGFPEICISALQFQRAHSTAEPHCYLWVMFSALNREPGSIGASLLEMAFNDYCKDSYTGLNDCQVCCTLDLSNEAGSTLNKSVCRYLSCQVLRRHSRARTTEGKYSENLIVFAWEWKQPESSLVMAMFDIELWLKEGRPKTLSFPTEEDHPRLLTTLAFSPENKAPTHSRIIDVSFHQHFFWRCSGTQDESVPMWRFLDVVILLEDGIEHKTCLRYCIANTPEGVLMSALRSGKIANTLTWLQKARLADGKMGSVVRSRSVQSWVFNMGIQLTDELMALCSSVSKGSWMCPDQASIQSLASVQKQLRATKTIMNIVDKQLKDHEPSAGSLWRKARRSVEQHSAYARVVQCCWDGTLLPQSVDNSKKKTISEMWLSLHQCTKAGQKDILGPICRPSSGLLVNEVLRRLTEQHGSLWGTVDENAHDIYPPPSLEALLKLYLLDPEENRLIHLTVLYFLLDVQHFWESQEDIVSIYSASLHLPLGFCQLVQGFWLLDRGETQAGLNRILSPSTWKPWLPWQHTWITKLLLFEYGAPPLALRYILHVRPPIVSPEDLRLRTQVLQLNRYHVDAEMLLRSVAGEEDACECLLQGGPRTCMCTSREKMDRPTNTCTGAPRCVLDSGHTLSLSGGGVPSEPLSGWLNNLQASGGVFGKPLIPTIKGAQVATNQQLLQSGRRDEPAIVWPTLITKQENQSPRLNAAAMFPRVRSNDAAAAASDGKSSGTGKAEDPAASPDFHLGLEDGTTVTSPASLSSSDHYYSPSEDSCAEEQNCSPHSQESDSQLSTGHSCSSESDLPFKEAVHAAGGGDGHYTDNAALKNQGSRSENDCVNGNCATQTLPHPSPTVVCCDLRMPDVRPSLIRRSVTYPVPPLEGDKEPSEISAEDHHRLKQELVEEKTFNAESRHLQSVCRNLGKRELCAESHSEGALGNLQPSLLGLHVPAEGLPGKLQEASCCSWETSSADTSFSSLPLLAYLELEPLRRAEEFGDQACNQEEEVPELQKAMEQPEILTLCDAPEEIGNKNEGHWKTSDNGFGSHEDRTSLWKDGKLQSDHGKSKILVRTSSFDQMERFLTRKLSHPCYSSRKMSWGSDVGLKNAGAFASAAYSPGWKTVISSTQRAPPFSYQPQTPCQKTKEQISFRSNSDELGNRKLGSWWKQALDTGRRPSAGLLPVFEKVSSSGPVSTVTAAREEGGGIVVELKVRDKATRQKHTPRTALQESTLFEGTESTQTLGQLKRTPISKSIFQQCSSRKPPEKSRKEDSVLKRSADRITVSRAEKQTVHNSYSAGCRRNRK